MSKQVCSLVNTVVFVFFINVVFILTKPVRFVSSFVVFSTVLILLHCLSFSHYKTGQTNVLWYLDHLSNMNYSVLEHTHVNISSLKLTDYHTDRHALCKGLCRTTKAECVATEQEKQHLCCDRIFI